MKKYFGIALRESQEPVIYYTAARLKSNKVGQMVVVRVPGQAMAQYFTGKEYKTEQEAATDIDRLNCHPAPCIFRIDACPAKCHPAKCSRKHVLNNMIHSLCNRPRLSLSGSRKE